MRAWSLVLPDQCCLGNGADVARPARVKILSQTLRSPRFSPSIYVPLFMPLLIVRPVACEEELELRVLCETYASVYRAKDASTISSLFAGLSVQSVYEDSVVQRQRWSGQNEPCLSHRLETS